MKNLIFAVTVCVLGGWSMQAQVHNKKLDSYMELFSKKGKGITAIETRNKPILKSGNVILLQDSLINYNWDNSINNWFISPNFKQTYAYNDQGRITQEMDYRWQASANSLVYDAENRYVWDNAGNQTVQIFNRFDTLSNSWKQIARDSIDYINNEPVSFTSYYYNHLTGTWFIAYFEQFNSAGQNTEAYFYDWDSTYTITYGLRFENTLNSRNETLEFLIQFLDPLTDSWINGMKMVVNYQNDTLAIDATIFSWNDSTAAWIPTDRDSFTYTDNLLTRDLYQSWNGAAFEDSTQVFYEYNSNRQIIKELFQSWNHTAWVNETQMFNEYNSDQKITKQLNQAWNLTDWENVQQNLMTYMAGSRSTESLYQQFINGSWVNYSFFADTYDNNDSITESLIKGWNTQTGLLTYGSRSLYTYEINYKKTVINQNWYSSVVDWVNSQRTDHYYSLHTLSHSPFFNTDLVLIYPNPATDVLFIDGLTGKSKISICDLSGKMLFREQITGNRIDISNFKSGFYFVKIVTEKGIINKGIVKQ